MHHKLQIHLLEHLFKLSLFYNYWKSTICHSLLRTFKYSTTTKFSFPFLTACNFCFLSFVLRRVTEIFSTLLLCNLLYVVIIFVCRTPRILHAHNTQYMDFFLKYRRFSFSKISPSLELGRWKNRLRLFPQSLYGTGGSTNNHKLLILNNTVKRIRLFLLKYYC